MTSDLRKGVFSSVLLVGESLLKKTIGLISTLILARVLLPEDFGVIAIAMLVIGLFEILSETGSTQYLLKVDELDEEKVNTSFTINLILKGILAILMVLAAYPVSLYYDNPSVLNIMLALTGVFALKSLSNPGDAYLRRAHDHLKIVKVSILAKIFAVSVGIYSALTFQNYWALVLGQASNTLLMVIGSYYVHPHRPKLTVKNAREQWNFSGWMIPQSVFGYVRTQLDTFIVSSVFGQAQLGSYQTMKYIAYIPSAHIILPAVQPFLVELRKAKHAPQLFAKQWNASFLIAMLIALPITVSVNIHHVIFTTVLLGNNWLTYSKLLGSFALLIPAFVMLSQIKRILIIYGRTKQIFIYECIAFTILYSSLFAVGLEDVEFFTEVRVIVENIICIFLLLHVSVKYTSVGNTLSLLLSCIPLFIGVIVSILISSFFASLPENILFQFALASTSCFVSFYATIMLCHFILFRKQREWKYLESLISRILLSIASKSGFVANR